MTEPTIRALLVALILSTASFAQAQPGTATTSAAAPPSATPRPAPPGFEPLPGQEARAEQVDANQLVVIAYAAFFLGMFGYVIHVARRQAAIAREVAELSRRVDRR